MIDVEYHYGPSSGVELVLTHEAERRYPWHVHVHHWSVGLVLSGTVVLETKDATRSLNGGECFIVRPCEAHRLDVAAKTSLATLCVKESKACVNLTNRLKNVLSVRDAKILERLGRSCIVGEECARSKVVGPEASIQNIIQQLMTKPEEKFSVAEMAALTGFSHWHFLRRFHGRTGMNPHAFQVACRLGLARLLLRADGSVVDAALSAGFADQSHMHKAFRLHHGLTPRQFIKSSFTLEP